MIRFCYLVPIIVFMCVTGILYKVNKYESITKKRPKSIIERSHSVSAQCLENINSKYN